MEADFVRIVQLTADPRYRRLSALKWLRLDRRFRWNWTRFDIILGSCYYGFHALLRTKNLQEIFCTQAEQKIYSKFLI